VTQRLSNIEVSRRLRLLLANQLIALSWLLRGLCKLCADRLFITARSLVPEAKRVLVYHRTGSNDRNRRLSKLTVRLGKSLSRILPHVVGGVLMVSGGVLIVLASVGSLDLVMRSAAKQPQPLAEVSAARHESQFPSDSNIVRVSKSSDVSETAAISTARIAPVPLPARKPERVYKAPNGKAARTNPATKKRIAHQQKKSRR
jgi:hypothetical protein